MKLWEVVRYELEYHLRNASTWIYAGILFLLAGWISLAMGADGDGGVHANAPERLADVSARVGMLGIFVTAALFGDAAVRDIEVEMDPLLFTSPIGNAEYLGGRFLGALAVNAVVVVAIPLGLLGMTALLTYIGPEVVGAVRVGAYVLPFLVFVLPNLVVVGAISFTIGILARRALPVYFGALGLFIGTIVALNYESEIEKPLFVALADPFGIVTLEQLTQLWTAAERNTRLVGLSLMLAWNRALWITLATAVLTLLYRRFRFAHVVEGASRSWLGRLSTALEAGRRPIGVAPPQSDRPRPVEVPRIAGSFGFRTTAWQTLAIARRSLADILASRWSLVVLLFCTGITILWGWNVADTVFDTSTWPITLLVAETVLSERVGPFPYVLIALYAGELVWREREVGEAGIAGATPVPEGAAVLGRFLALTTLIAMAQAATMVGGLLIQALQGYYHFELGLYVRILFGLKLAEYILIAALAMTIHVLVNHKYLAHILVLMTVVSTRALPMLGTVRHHLLLYGTDPGWTYSDMNGFGPFIGPFIWFKLYWAAWALLLTVVAVLSWVRGDEPGLPRRLRQARARFIGPVARTASVAIALIVLLGGFIFYNTNILNAYRSTNEAGRPQAEYEQRYKRYEDVPQPIITAADLRVEIYPDEPAVDLRGTYRLVNRTAAAIDSVHVLFVDPNIEVRALSFDRAAKPVLVDDEVRYRIFALERALEPGDPVQLTFDVAFRPRGFPNSGMQTDVVKNGAYFNRSDVLPLIGYQPMLELSEAEARRRFGLNPQPPMPGPDDAKARRYRDSRDAHNVHMNAVVGTSADQIAVTPGVLRRSWSENGRRYFHYETDASAPFSPTIFSARYAALEDRWTGNGQAVDLRIYHHPAHGYVLDRMLRSMKASLDYYTTQFGPYGSDHLRIVETPRYVGSFGSAHPQTISVREHGFFSRVREGEIDQPFYGIAHEIAHQYWPLQAKDAAARGRGFLSESLANYSAMMVTEKTYGPEVARRVYDFQMERYLNGRASQSREVPLLQVEDQSYIAYRKGAIAMYTLREQIGEERVNTALRGYLEKHRNAPPYATSLDVYAELRAVTPDSLQSLLTDLFETVTLWDVKTERAVLQPTGTGEYHVTLDVVAKKMRADSVGNETEVPMDHLVEIGVFAPGTGESLGVPVYLERHRIRSGKQTIRITVSPKLRDVGPARAGIDPYRKLIDRGRDDNVVEVTR